MIILLSMENKMIKIQSVSDIITNSSSEVFMIFTREGINTFKEIISTLIGEDFDNRFNLEICLNDYALEEYEDDEDKGDMSFEDWCFKHDEQGWEGSTYVEGFYVTAKDPQYKEQASMINQIYCLFESEERYC